MSRRRIFTVADRLTVYAIERQAETERRQSFDTKPRQEQRRFWTDAILQGMEKLDGLPHDPRWMEEYDQRLASAHVCEAVENLSLKEQAALIRDLSKYVLALESAGGDRRRQIAVVGELLEDMAAHRSWALGGNGLSVAREYVEHTLLRMTAQTPIRFTRILLGGAVGPHWVSGFVPGAVTDAETVRGSSVYAEAVQTYPEIAEWPALCTVYVGHGLPSALGTMDACAFDLEIMNRAGDRFLREQGIRCVGGPYQMTVFSTPTMDTPQMEPMM